MQLYLIFTKKEAFKLIKVKSQFTMRDISTLIGIFAITHINFKERKI